MHSIEKHIANLLRQFFYKHEGDFSLEINKEITEYINQHSYIHFDNLQVNCTRQKNIFSGFIKSKCLTESIIKT